MFKFNLFIFLISLLLFSVVFLIYFLKKIFKTIAFKKVFNYQLFLIKIPREINLESQKAHQDKFIFLNLFNQFLESLVNYSKEFIFEIANPLSSKEICFYLACDRSDAVYFEKNLVAFFPFAQMELVAQDYTIFNPQGESIGSIIKTKEHFCLPIRNYSLFEDDPLKAIVNSFLKIEKEGEGASFQVVVKKAPESYKKSLLKIKEEVLKGKSLKEITSLPSFGETFVSSFKEALKSQNIKPEQQNFSQVISPQSSEPKKIDETLLKLIEEKLSSSLFSVNLRILVSSETKERAEEILSHIENSFSQFTHPVYNDLKIIRQKKRAFQNLILNFSLRLFNPKEEVIFNSKEITSLFHFPHPFIENNRIKWLKARVAPPPNNLPEEGALLGINNYLGEEREVRILDEDRRRHIYIIGQTGTGKSTLLKNIIYNDIVSNKGVCFVDPHGDLAEELLGLIPDSRIEDVVYFNPGNFQRSFGLNMLEWDKNYPFQKTFVVNELLEIFDKLYDLKAVGGPIFEQYFRNAMFLLLEDEEVHTLIDVPRVLVNPDFRAKLLKRSPNPLVIEFWQKEAEKAGGELALANVAPYINSKLAPFLSNDLIRPIVGQEHSSIDFRKIMDEGKILIVNLSKGLLGETNSYLLGMIIIGKILMAAFSRVDVLEEQRRDFYVFIDEFQNVTTNTISVILSEARKYRLNLTIAHQYLAQLKENILKAVFGNVGTLISFRVGKEDAEFLAKYFEPVFSAYDLMNLDNFNAYIRLLIQNQTTRPFSIQTLKGPKPDPSRIEKIKQLSYLKYTLLREEVEEKIKARYHRE
ncbi:MAG: type IV secretory system conjugative DNA transfer family protein [Candidatus Paceibacterota bacterium]